MGERGVALLMAVVMIGVAAIFTLEFGTNTNVEYAAATNHRDDMRAHFMARSGMNLAELIIRVQTDVIDPNRQMLGDIQLADFVPMFIGAFGGSKEEVNDFAGLLGVRGDDVKGLGTEIGTFDVEITTDDGKINVNCAGGNEALQTALKTKLEALFYFDLYNPVFENPDAEGWRRDRAQQVAAIIDYIDRDRAKLGVQGVAEDYGYQTLDDRYKAKNNYLDTLGEMKMIRGVDDRFWALFGDQFTIYGGCKENLAAVEDPKLIAAIIFLSAKDPSDPVINTPAKLWALAVRVSEAREWGIFFDQTQAFVDFVKDPNGAMSELFAASGLEGASTPQQSGMVEVDGVELDPQKLNQIAETGSRRTYRVKATAQIGEGGYRLVKTIEGVWDKKTTNQNPRGPEYRHGAWVFWREK